MKTLIDTCVAIDFMRNFENAVEFIVQLESQPYISTITVAELYAGTKTEKKERMVTSFVENCLVLDVT